VLEQYERERPDSLPLLNLAIMSEVKMKRNLITICLATLGAAFALIAISEAASTSVRPTRPTHHAKSIRGRFSVLGSAKVAAASAETALPALSASHFTEPDTLMSELELEPAQSRFVTFDSNTHGWVIPGRRGLCLAVRGAISIVSICNHQSSAEQSGLVMVLQASAGPVIYGLVPDGASVAVTSKDGATTGVTVTGNVFKESDPSAQSVTVRSAAGGSPTVTPVS
jgi:putative exporter of polyketide antibiotics